MNRSVPFGADFRERYVIERFGDGGVLIDLSTGTYLRLNLTAAEICSILATADDADSVPSQVSRRLGQGETEAHRSIQEVIAGLSQLGPRREPSGAFRYVPGRQDAYVLTSGGVPRLSIAADGMTVRLVSPSDRFTTAQVHDYLRAIAPKVLFLQSKVVMHGAASRTTSGVRVISGESGAGKTTTARAFDAVGSSLLAEDMLVVASLSPFQVRSGGEKVINTWARLSAERLGRNPHDEIDASFLQASSEGDPLDVSEVWFIDGSRRDPGSDIRPRRLGQTDGALALMTSLFLGSSSGHAWREFLSCAAAIATSTAIYEALMPDGLERLRAAAKRYNENSAS